MSQTKRYIESSKYKCQHVYNLDPTTIPVLSRSLSKEEFIKTQQKYKHALSIVKEFMQKLISFLSGTPTYILTTDSKGYVLDSYGDESIQQMTTSLGIKEGVQFHEQEAGTNSITLAIEHGEPVHLIGDDHYHHCFEDVACYSAPFSVADGELSGTISLMTTKEHASEFHMGLLSSAVDSIEREIHTQKENQELLVNNQVLMDTTPLGIVITNKEGTISNFNQSAQDITGWEQQLVVGKHISILNDLSPYFHYVLDEKEAIENIELTMPDQQKTCLVDVLPLFNHGNLIGAFGQFKDVTSYIQLQNQVIQSEKLSEIGRLSAGFAHEIRNPLTSIIGLTKLLQIDESQSKYIEIIQSELERIKNLVNEFVMYGKPGNGQKQITNLVTIIKDTIELMNHTAQKQHAKLHFKEPDDQVSFYVDESQFKQILINLINNALDAMGEGGNVWIDLKVTKTNLFITISDEGKGMSAEEIENFGTPFFSTKEKGLGIGLSICSDIVKSHNGKISVESTDENGTTIKLSFPYEAKNKRRINIS